MRSVTILAIAGMLSACATSLDTLQTRDEWLSETVREFDVPPESVLKAADIVLRHNDPENTIIQHKPTGLTASRQFSGFYQGGDTWNLDVSGRIYTVGASRNLRMRSPVISHDGTPIHIRGTYQLFWARVEYVLGIRPDWILCRDAAKAFGSTEAHPARFAPGLCDDPAGANEPAPARL